MEEYVFKIVVLGEKSTGKSSIIRRYVHDSFEGRYTGTIGLNVSNKVIQFDNIDAVVSILIYDIEAEAEFEDLFEPFADGTSAALFVFDLTRPETLSAISNWVERLKSISNKSVLENSALIGNKIDLSRVVEKNVAISTANDLSMFNYYETSAKTGKEVDKVFEILAQRILELNTKN